MPIFSIFGGAPRIVSKDSDGFARHQDIGTEKAYAIGLDQLLAGGPLGGTKAGMFFLLPAAVRARSGSPKPYDLLDPLERKAIDWLYRVVLPLAPSEVGYPQPNGPYIVSSIWTFVRKNGLKTHDPAKVAGLISMAGEFLDEAIASYDSDRPPSYDLGSETGRAALLAAGNPELLHHAAVHAMAGMDEPADLLAALAEHPDLNRATAAWIMCYAEMDRWLAGAPSLDHSVMADAPLKSVLATLCIRGAEGRFPPDRIGLDPALDLQSLIDAAKRHGMPDDLPWPASLFDAPVPTLDPAAMAFGEADADGQIRPRQTRGA